MGYIRSNISNYGGLGRYYGLGFPGSSIGNKIRHAGQQVTRQVTSGMSVRPSSQMLKPKPKSQPKPKAKAKPKSQPKPKAKAKPVALPPEIQAKLAAAGGFLPRISELPPSAVVSPEVALDPAATTVLPVDPSKLPPGVAAPLAPGYMMPGMMARPGMPGRRVAPLVKPLITPQQARLGTIAAALGAGLFFF